MRKLGTVVVAAALMLCVASPGWAAQPVAGIDKTFVPSFSGTHRSQTCSTDGNNVCTVSGSAAVNGAIDTSAATSTSLPSYGSAQTVSEVYQRDALKAATPALRFQVDVDVTKAVATTSNAVAGPTSTLWLLVYVSHSACSACTASVSSTLAATDGSATTGPGRRTVTVELRNPAGPLPKGTVTVTAALDTFVGGFGNTNPWIGSGQAAGTAKVLSFHETSLAA
jgi:hypothetical protein